MENNNEENWVPTYEQEQIIAEEVIRKRKEKNIMMDFVFFNTLFFL